MSAVTFVFLLALGRSYVRKLFYFWLTSLALGGTDMKNDEGSLLYGGIQTKQQDTHRHNAKRVIVR
jgi:hypothetical protein